ncbi:hypothetical protein BCR35DRAFT_301832 [Leucosporidium creatinivorum]|uniref:Uncharacterized protein n=1 Tax=Leucosporidium creatinivorum TaxID=106004 RepID=A0A1Y2FWF0_9BASI|nr:hypothetical protein BCR35DRAFT_301832 [Leucosporidium creatinivorum]
MTTSLPLPLPLPSATQADESDASSLDWDSSSCSSCSSSTSGSSSSSPASYRRGVAQFSLSAGEGEENNTDAKGSKGRKSKGGRRTSKKEKRKSHSTMATSIFTRSNSAADWEEGEGEGDAEQQEEGAKGGRSRLGVSAPVTPRRGLSPPPPGERGKKVEGGRKRSLTDVLGLGAGKAREVEEGLSSWINASPSPFETDLQPPSSSAPTSPLPRSFPRFPLATAHSTPSTSNAQPQPSNLAQSLALNRLGLPAEWDESEGAGEGRVESGVKRERKSWGFIPGPGVEVCAGEKEERERREASEGTIKPEVEVEET